MLCSHSIFRKQVTLASAHITYGGRDGENRWRIDEIFCSNSSPCCQLGSLFLLKPFLRLDVCRQGHSSLGTHCMTVA